MMNHCCVIFKILFLEKHSLHEGLADRRWGLIYCCPCKIFELQFFFFMITFNACRRSIIMLPDCSFRDNKAKSFSQTLTWSSTPKILQINLCQSYPCFPPQLADKNADAIFLSKFILCCR